MGLGDMESTLQWLREAYNQRSSSLVLVSDHPMADAIRADPRMRQLLSDMGIEK